ncbi:hypothetical protein BABINDRAFT_164851 [Babjeviella inositovora NRRL Y-12698]|uniref:RING-type domain-containing protein n=1 Tax=Babjeviella inositovora NRRL Y-12698 TaxID=984486 RepID=A0A1E3QZR8_9ASCO|nr:uncharacterized protein BABINDRAFT_164851 [Babjeviella inositovora NRRL Y-12698]ODQ83146.1 hypothetical protein BABINDRAFT_164851 [Babjeviella inositovora NRRL Y-12698]
MATYEDDHNITLAPQRQGAEDSGREHQSLFSVLNSFMTRAPQPAAADGSHDFSAISGADSAAVDALRNSLRVLSSEAGSTLAHELMEQLENNSSDFTGDKGVSDAFIDDMERVSVKDLKLIKTATDTCAICTNDFGNDQYPLLVALPTCKHVFDLECIGPWLKFNKTCPLCRSDVTVKKKLEIAKNYESEEEEEDWEMYG